MACTISSQPCAKEQCPYPLFTRPMMLAGRSPDPDPPPDPDPDARRTSDPLPLPKTSERDPDPDSRDSNPTPLPPSLPELLLPGVWSGTTAGDDGIGVVDRGDGGGVVGIVTPGGKKSDSGMISGHHTQPHILEPSPHPQLRQPLVMASPGLYTNASRAQCRQVSLRS